MNADAHAWWSRLRHQGLLLSPVVMLERYPDRPEPAGFYPTRKLKESTTRLQARLSQEEADEELARQPVLAWLEALLQTYVCHPKQRVVGMHSFPPGVTTTVRIGTRNETLRPHRVVMADAATRPALLVMADTSPQVGRGRGRTAYARFVELLRGTGQRLGLLSNGRQVRLVYAGLDFEAWAEWDADHWFADQDGEEELAGLRQLLAPSSLAPAEGPGLLAAVEESRKRQADLSSVLRENVRQAVELLLDEASGANRTDPRLFEALATGPDSRRLSDAEAQDALFQGAVRVVMRLVVCLFAEAKQLLPVNDPVYARSYGVRTLYELLEEAVRDEGGAALLHRQGAWPRLMGLFRIIHGGSPHGQFPLRSYGGALFRPGDPAGRDAVARALHLLEHRVSVADATVHQVLRKLLRGPLPVLRGRQKTFVEGPVDYTDLRTEFIGLIYEGLLDYRLQRSDEKTGPLLFLNLGREPVLPLARLEAMLADDKPGLKSLLTTLRKEKATATVEAEEEEEKADEEEAPEEDADAAEEGAEIAIEQPDPLTAEARSADHIDAAGRARAWACEAAKLAGLVGKQGRRQSDIEYQRQVEAEADRLVRRVVATGEFYLVRAGNVRKGTGTFYTRPQLAVPTAHRTLEPLCYDRPEGGPRVPKTPEAILALKVCDPACGSASFLVAALHYLTDALYESMRQHRSLEDAAAARTLTLPLGHSRADDPDGEALPFYPDDPKFGHLFPERVKARLRRFVVERCVYGVDLNPLAVELARVSLWVETLDPELPFSFLDHKIKVGNALVGCWLDRVLDYPIAAWERNGGDDPDSKTAGPRTERIQTLLSGPRGANRRRPSEGGLIKQQMRQVIDSRFTGQPSLFGQDTAAMDQVVGAARKQYEQLHRLPISETERQEEEYHRRFSTNPLVLRLKRAMDEWCAVWFWPMDEGAAQHAPTPLTFHAAQAERDRILDRLVHDLRFFHWELEFPDVFTPERAGFDAVLGNPPWEVMKPNSHEFFTAYDPLYRTYDKQAALTRQRELFVADPVIRSRWDEYNATFKALVNWVRNAADPFSTSLALGGRGEELKGSWERARRDRVGYASREQPYRHQGGADLNSYKLFLEVFHYLLRPAGRLGVVVPSGVYWTSPGFVESGLRV